MAKTKGLLVYALALSLVLISYADSSETLDRNRNALAEAGARVTLDDTGRIVSVYFGDKASDEKLPLVRNLKHLKWLNLGSAKITNNGLANLEGLRSLEYLSLPRTQISDAALVHLKGLTNLRELLIQANNITDAGLKHLQALRNLQVLEINNTLWVNSNMNITDTGMEHLKQLKKLQTINLMKTDVTADGLAHLTELPELTTLWLSGPKITDAAMPILAKIKGIKRLELRFTAVTDEGMKYIREMPNLELFNIASRNVTDAGLAHIEGLENLKKLELRDKHFGDASLKHIVKLPALERVDLVGSTYTADGLELLKDIDTLRSLWLYGIHISQAELELLSGFTHLEELTLSTHELNVPGPDLHDRAIAVRRQLRQALPNTKIHLGPYNFILDESNVSAATGASLKQTSTAQNKSPHIVVVPIGPDEKTKRGLEKRITVDFDNTPIDDTVRIIKDQADLDVIYSPKLKGNVKAVHSDVAIGWLLSEILKPKGFDYLVYENLVTILPTEQIVARKTAGNLLLKTTDPPSESLNKTIQKLKKPISVDFREMPVEVAVQIMAEQADLKFTISPDIKGNVTFMMTEVQIGLVLREMLSHFSYGYVIEEDSLKIIPNKEIEQIKIRTIQW